LGWQPARADSTTKAVTAWSCIQWSPGWIDFLIVAQRLHIVKKSQIEAVRMIDVRKDFESML
jgi:hypothetical protein